MTVLIKSKALPVRPGSAPPPKPLLQPTTTRNAAAPTPKKNTFTVTYAAKPPVSSRTSRLRAHIPPLQPRDDIDMRTQHYWVTECRNAVADQVALAAWEHTKASRANHLIFLRILTVEGYRYQHTRTPAAEQPDLRRTTLQLLQSITSRMTSDPSKDHYPALLQDLMALGLFYSDSMFATAVSGRKL